MSNERSKQAAAERALVFVEDGMKVGLGTGSTSEAMVRLLAERVRTSGLQLELVATSRHIAEMATSLGLQMQAGYPDFDRLDVTLDGADEVDPFGGLIKGGGGALLREKLVAAASRRLIIMVDDSKHSDFLGTKWAVPVEVVPFGWSSLRRRLEALGCQATLRVKGGQTFVTDHGNWIYDCQFGSMADASRVHSDLKRLVGVVETGLFLGMCSSLVTGREDGTAEVAHF